MHRLYIQGKVMYWNTDQDDHIQETRWALHRHNGEGTLLNDTLAHLRQTYTYKDLMYLSIEHFIISPL